MDQHLEVSDARRLTERIRLVAVTVSDNLDKLKSLVVEAREGNVHIVLGYASWTAYLADVLGQTPLRLERDVRQELVAELSAQGMSTRAIAPIVGVSREQVRIDVAGDKKLSPGALDAAIDKWLEGPAGAVLDTDTGEVTYPDPVTEVTETHTVKTVTGLDGKTYTPTPPKKPNRRAITDTARDAGWEIRKAAERLERIREDDRYSRNREEVAAHLRSHLLYTIETCQGLLDDLNKAEGEQA